MHVSEIEIDKLITVEIKKPSDEILNYADEKELKNKDNSETDELYNEALEIIKSEKRHLHPFCKKITNWI